MKKADLALIRFLDSWHRTPRPWLTPEIEKQVEAAMKAAWTNGYGNGKADGSAFLDEALNSGDGTYKP